MDSTRKIYDFAKSLDCDARQNEPMSRHTSFKIGGAADAYIQVSNLSQLTKVIAECKKNSERYMIIGNGSNILADDKGFRGTVIKLEGDFRVITLIDDATIYCGAGATLAFLCKFALGCGLSGLEFAWGIPGTVGGAIFMNAGAYDGEMKNVVHCVSHITEDGEIGRTEKDGLNFGYRTSVYRNNGCIITGVTLKLRKGNPDSIRAKMDDFMTRRTSKQPLEFPSAGSVFKRPKGNFAGALIEQCGLKGRSVGGAQVSEKHAGFIINKSNATSDDVKNLIKEIQDSVLKNTGYSLECELIIL